MKITKPVIQSPSDKLTAKAEQALLEKLPVDQKTLTQDPRAAKPEAHRHRRDRRIRPDLAGQLPRPRQGLPGRGRPGDQKTDRPAGAQAG